MNRRDLAGHAHGWFRTWFAKVWKVRGGGLYACGYAITFVYLEVSTVAEEIAESESIGAFIQEQLIEFIFRFALESFVNLLQALMWPVYIVQYRAPFGAIALGIAFVVFPITLKKPIEKWLLPETEDTI